jgi:EAL domain-containing protein (putative c-di-GMP-specific phosphodiesterase class I)
MLRDANIQAAEGFYFSTPLPAEAFVTFHRDHGAQAPPAGRM